MFGLIVGISLIASVAGAEPPSTPLLAPRIAQDVSLPQEMILPTWRYELSQEPELEALAKCESGIKETALNNKDSDGEPKYGVWQYDADTWIAFQVEMGIEPTLNIYSGADQYKLTKWAFANGKQSHWGVCL